MIDSIGHDASGDIRISWQATPGFNYAVEYSDDLLNWQGDLPSSTFPSPPALQPIIFTDTTVLQAGGRYYRVRQTRAE